MANKCKELTTAGVSCEANAGPSGYCAFHDPTQAEVQATAKVKGGIKAGVNKSARKLAPERPAFKIDGPAGVIRMVKAVMRELYNEPTTARFDIAEKARALAYVGGVLLKAYELAETDERLTVLEQERGVH